MTHRKASIEEQVSRVASSGSPLNEIADRIRKLIEDNLTEALSSSSEFIRKKAEQLKEVG